MPKKSQPPTSDVLRAVEEAGRGVNIKEIATELLAAFGGPQQFASTYAEEFKEATGIARAKALEGVLRVMSAAGSKEAGDNYDAMTLEELQEELAGILHPLTPSDAGGTDGEDAADKAAA